MSRQQGWTDKSRVCYGVTRVRARHMRELLSLESGLQLGLLFSLVRSAASLSLTPCRNVWNL